MNIKIKLLRSDASIPQRMTDGAIGYDLRVPNDTYVSGIRTVIPLGFAIELPDGVEAKIEPRSGFSARGIDGYYYNRHSGGKMYLSGEPLLFNADVLVGKIDPDYRGEVAVILRNNDPDRPFVIKAGTRIAQMTFYRVELPALSLSEELTTTDRANQGFGHTGIN